MLGAGGDRERSHGRCHHRSRRPLPGLPTRTDAPARPAPARHCRSLLASCLAAARPPPPPHPVPAAGTAPGRGWSQGEELFSQPGRTQPHPGPQHRVGSPGRGVGRRGINSFPTTNLRGRPAGPHADGASCRLLDPARAPGSARAWADRGEAGTYSPTARYTNSSARAHVRRPALRPCARGCPRAMGRSRFPGDGPEGAAGWGKGGGAGGGSLSLSTAHPGLGAVIRGHKDGSERGPCPCSAVRGARGGGRATPPAVP